MNQIISKFSVDFSKPSQAPVVYAVQGECNARSVEMELFSDGTPWQIPTGASLAVRYGRVNLTGGYYDTLPDGIRAWDYTGNIISLVLASQMMAMAGIVHALIEIHHQGGVLRTFPFLLKVSPDPAAGIVESENYINIQQWLERELDQYIEKVKQSGEFLGGTMAGPINMNGQKLTGLDAPEADTEAASKGYVLGLARKAAPRNLLDNSDFRNPVNQRGKTSYTGASVYSIDRWKIGNTAVVGTCTLCATGISLVPNEGEFCDLVQNLEGYISMKGRPYTIVYQDSNGNVYSAPFTMGHNYGILLGELEFFSLDDMNVMFRTPVNVAVTIVWAALYEGEYAVDTIPPYQPKGYGVEFLECMRYYYRNWNGQMSPSTIANLYCPLNARTTSVTFPVPMRVTPTITLYNPVTEHSGCITDWSTDVDVSAVVVYSNEHHFILGGSMTAGQLLAYNYEASADL